MLHLRTLNNGSVTGRFGISQRHYSTFCWSVQVQHGGFKSLVTSGLVSSRWFVAETQPRKEEYARQNLHRQQFTSFCPRFRKVRKHARREDVVLAPLFPGYIFVLFDTERHAWRSINGTFGIRRVLSGDDANPQPVPEAVMRRLLARCKGEIVTSLIEVPEVGQSVRIVNGPLAERLGTIESLDDHGRVRVLLELLGSECSVRMDMSAVSPA